MATIGNSEAFRIDDEFALYKDNLEYFFKLNKITEEERKVKCLAIFGGADLY